MKISGMYDMDTIKYFKPRPGMIMAFNCPYCGEKIEIDAGDGLIEYPEPDQKINWINCDCGRTVTIRVKISMPVDSLYEVQP